jgi:hypothetical protein
MPPMKNQRLLMLHTLFTLFRLLGARARAWHAFALGIWLL